MRRSRRSLDQLLALAGLPLTYPEVGATSGALPAGYQHLLRHRRLGSGEACFDAAVEHLMTWGMHRGAGLTVDATGARARVGTDVLVGIGWRRLRLMAPCRVVHVVDEPGRQGFAYGTLSGHPESGEEQFVVTRDADGAVHVDITAFSRPGRWWVRLTGPFGRRLQAFVTDRYLASFAPIGGAP